MTWRKVQVPRNPKGLALGWLIGAQADASLVTALPGWSIIVTDQAPLTVTFKDLLAARTMGGCSAVTPVALFGWSAGVQSVRSVLVAKLVNPWAVAVFDGTHAEAPPETKPWKIQVWADLADKARLGQVRFTATATRMAYTKDIPVGSAGRAWPTSWVLGRALGLGDQGLVVGSPVVDRGLYVEVFQSPDFPHTQAEWDAAAKAHTDQINVVAPGLLATFWGADTTMAVVKPGPAVEAWQDPTVGLGERFARWAVTEWGHHYAEAPAGSNDSPRIREYDQVPFVRGPAQEPITAPRTAWCAKMAGAGLAWSSIPGDSVPPLRVSGIEYQQDATTAKTWIPVGSGLPARGDLAIFRRPGLDWYRHVTIVVGCTGDQAEIIGGNEGDTIGRRNIMITGSKRDPDLLGFVRIG